MRYATVVGGWKGTVLDKHSFQAVKSRDDGWGNDEEVLRSEKTENWAEESLFS